jgi:ribokinase
MGLITVIGSMNMDMVVQAERLPDAGETIAGNDFHLIPGGKGANQAVAASRAGATVQMFGCVGRDAFGRVLLDSLASAGVEVKHIRQMENVPTGTATILVDNHGENRIIIVPGTNGQVTRKMIEEEWRAISVSDMVLLQHEIPLESVQAAILKAHSQGIRVVLNPAPVYPIPEKVLACVDVLILNENEASVLTGLPVTDSASARKAAARLREKGAGTVIITLGSGGVVLQNGIEDLFQPAFKVGVVDSTAAGDTFTGCYAAAVHQGYTAREALIYATAASALAVTRLGAQTSIPSREDVLSFMQNQIEIAAEFLNGREKGG